MNTENATTGTPVEPIVMPISDYGWVIETTEPVEDGRRFWRGGHSGNKYYGAVRGFVELSKAKVFTKKNAAISKCVELGSKTCNVRRIELSVAGCVYPPSRAEA
jgi:hypothetical protein